MNIPEVKVIFGCLPTTNWKVVKLECVAQWISAIGTVANKFLTRSYHQWHVPSWDVLIRTQRRGKEMQISWAGNICGKEGRQINWERSGSATPRRNEKRTKKEHSNPSGGWRRSHGSMKTILNQKSVTGDVSNFPIALSKLHWKNWVNWKHFSDLIHNYQE